MLIVGLAMEPVLLDQLSLTIEHAAPRLYGQRRASTAPRTEPRELPDASAEKLGEQLQAR
jgi:hypothetical protein